MPMATMPTRILFRVLKTTKFQIRICTIMGVPRMTVVYTLQTRSASPSRGLRRPGRCWSWAVRTMATASPRTRPMEMAAMVIWKVTPRPLR